MKNKKVLVFSLVEYPAFIGGAEVALYELIKRLSKDGYTFDVISIKSKRFFTIKKYTFPIWALPKAIYLSSKNDYGFVWSMMANYAGFAALFYKILFPKKKFVLTLQEGDPIEYIIKRVGIFKPIFINIFKKADVIQCISSYLKKDFALKMGVNEDKVIVIPNGVDLNKFTSSSIENIKKLKENLHIKNDDIVCISSSRLVEKNGVVHIIKAISFLPDNYKLILVGDGFLRNNLEVLSGDLKISNRVFFVGSVKQETLVDYLHLANIFVRPSLSEGFGNSFIEAMASGLPVIGTGVGGIKEFLVNMENGLICNVNDPKDLSDKIKMIGEDKTLREKLIKNGFDTARKYSWDNLSKDFEVAVLI